MIGLLMTALTPRNAGLGASVIFFFSFLSAASTKTHKDFMVRTAHHSL
jgi:hypothetical protein